MTEPERRVLRELIDYHRRLTLHQQNTHHCPTCGKQLPHEWPHVRRRYCSYQHWRTHYLERRRETARSPA